MQDLNDMVLFARVVEHGSYTAAAKALGLPTSRLSRRISELEKRLDVRLLQRTTRRVTVTEIGQLYYQHCAALVAEAAAAQDTIDRTRSEPQGLIRVSCPIPLIRSHVGAMVAEFLAEHPKVQVYLEATGRRVNLIEEGFDVALRVRTPPLESSGLVVRELGESGTCLVASPQLLKRVGRPAHPSALGAMPTVSETRAGERFVWEFRDGAGTQLLVTHTPRMITDDFEAMRRAALRGVGVAYLPYFVVQRDVMEGRLVTLLTDFNIPAGLIHAVFPSRRGMVPAVRAFIDTLVAEFRRIGGRLEYDAPVRTSARRSTRRLRG